MRTLVLNFCVLADAGWHDKEFFIMILSFDIFWEKLFCGFLLKLETMMPKESFVNWISVCHRPLHFSHKGQLFLFIWLVSPKMHSSLYNEYKIFSVKRHYSKTHNDGNFKSLYVKRHFKIDVTVLWIQHALISIWALLLMSHVITGSWLVFPSVTWSVRWGYWQ